MKEELINKIARKLKKTTLASPTAPIKTFFEKEKFVIEPLSIRATKSYLFCNECFSLRVSNKELNPANIISSFFCPVCQSEASGKLENQQVIYSSMKAYPNNESIVESLKKETGEEDVDSIIKTLKTIEKEYQEWIDTQSLMGCALLFSTKDVIDVFTEAQLRKFMNQGQVNGEQLSKGPSSPSSSSVQPADPYLASVSQLFKDLHRQRITLNDNLEENIVNKGF